MIDSIEKIENAPLYVMKKDGNRNDTTLFYTLENYEEIIMNSISKKNISLQEVKESLVQVIDKLLITTNSAIVIENMNQYSIDSKLSYFIKRFIPSNLWSKILNNSMNYYNKFILKLIRDITIMNYSVVKACSSEKSILREISSEWVENYLYKIQDLFEIQVD